jgi:septal ring factor EnvC (AmiA/AmiB activator)
MTRAQLCTLALGALTAFGCPALAQDRGVAAQAAKASVDLQAAVTALDQAASARDRVTALTQTIRAYEDGLAALREALRQAHLREATLTLQFQAKRDRLAQLLGILSQLEAQPGPLLLLHPSGPLGTVRSGMLLADVTPALQAEADGLKAELTELRDLRALQVAAAKTLTDGLTVAKDARSGLSQAISDRTALPLRFTESPSVLRGLLETADTLQAFAGGLMLDETPDRSFADAKGTLTLPVLGTLLRTAYEADAAGVRRPGIALATRAHALVTTPWPATIRYRGPLFDYGNVIVLEPGGGYLLILAGLDTVYGEVGEVLAPGAAVGLMGGGGSMAGANLSDLAENVGGVQGTQTLYMEIRQGADPVDPAEWFTTLKEQDQR